MKSLAIIGSQWGDEGKGKITDLLGAKSDVVVRYQGGNNAGHTIIVGNKKIVLHLIPSGILHSHCVSVIGHGVVFDPESFLKELDTVKASAVNVTADNLKISTNTSVITFYNKLLDGQRESKGPVKIGTTGKGIGPAYEDKVSRKGIKVKDLFDLNVLKTKLADNLTEKAVLFEKLYQVAYPSVEEEATRLYELGKIIKPFACDTFSYLDQAARAGKKILFEGAQGVLLDVDYGTYPYVTSSNTSVGGIFTGAGIPSLDKVDEVIGITKAYTTRVGEGPFPTELFDEIGEKIQTLGAEFGATTGRKRRCGWLDLPIIKYSVKCSKITSLALTKVDILNNFESIKVCTSYRYKGEVIDCAYPGIDLSQVEPIYEEVSGFHADFAASELPPALKSYLQLIEKHVGIPVGIVAFGPERSQVKMLKEYL